MLLVNFYPFAVFILAKEGFLLSIGQRAFSCDLWPSWTSLAFKGSLLCMLHVCELLCLRRAAVGSGRPSVGETLWLDTTSRRSHHLLFKFIVV